MPLNIRYHAQLSGHYMFCLMHSRLQYAIEAWGNSNILQNCKGYTNVQ